MPLLDVGLVCRDQRAQTDQPAGIVQHSPLFRRRDRHRSVASAFGPRPLDGDVVAMVSVTGLELNGFFPSQTEGGLQAQTCADVWIGDPGQSVTQFPGGHIAALGYAKAVLFAGRMPGLRIFSAHQRR